LKGWDQPRSPKQNRGRLDQLLAIACTRFGFCGGPRWARDELAGLKSITATDFAFAILRAEGMAQGFERDSDWRPRLEAVFRDAFGTDSVELAEWL
jgi:hypothetical protein